MTQELNFVQPELALAELHIKLMITQSLKHNTEILFMLFLTLRKDQDVINEDHDKLVHLFHENRVHQAHEVSGGLGKDGDGPDRWAPAISDGDAVTGGRPTRAW
jgi:hypothetical protein